MSHVLCRSDELAEGQSRGFSAGEVELLAVRRDGQVYCWRNSCPHRGIPLEWQPDQFLDLSGTLIQCASHGALFLVETGECVAGPCSGQHLQKLACVEQDGLLILLD